MLLLLAQSAARAEEPPVVFEVLYGEAAGVANRIKDASFEQVGRAVSDWRGFRDGFQVDREVAHRGAQSIRCNNPDGQRAMGAHFRLAPERPTASMLRISAWSRAADVAAARSADYAIYVDLTHADHTHTWGVVRRFNGGTHGWQRAELLVAPSRPVTVADIYLLFRNIKGTVWFDDARVEVLDDRTTTTFDGQPVRAPGPTSAPAATQPVVQVWCQPFGGHVLAGAPEGLALSVEHPSEAQTRAIVRKNAAGDRAVTLVLARPFDAVGGWWLHDPRRRRRIDATGVYHNLVDVPAGKLGLASRYPLVAVTSADGRRGVALAVPMNRPRLVRLSYHARCKRLVAAFDLGLCDDAAKRANGTEVTVETFDFDAAGGFRAAWAEYMRRHPEWFARRIDRMGIWMPFAKISEVERWQDFGFRFKEGTNETAWDQRHDILTFRYTEPQTHWQPMAPGQPRDYAGALRALTRQTVRPPADKRRTAAAALVSGVWDAAGNYWLDIRDEPWCHGAVFAANPDPDIPDGLGRVEYDPQQARRYFAEGVDGEYLDSLGGWGKLLNFRREHFAHADTPPVFDRSTGKPALLNRFSVAEFVRSVADDVHAQGRLTMANFGIVDHPWFAGWLDVSGQETNWKVHGRWSPLGDAEMLYRRCLSGRKPYLLLMNTDFDRWTRDDTERYFKRCAAYGVLPSFFSHDAATRQYFRNPEWYHRDRPLFVRWIPLIRRLAEAGWRPMTEATVAPEPLQVERFAGAGAGSEFFVVHNPSSHPVDGRLRLDGGPNRAATAARELVGGGDVSAVRNAPGTFPVPLEAYDTWILTPEFPAP